MIADRRRTPRVRHDLPDRIPPPAPNPRAAALLEETLANALARRRKRYNRIDAQVETARQMRAIDNLPDVDITVEGEK